MKYDNRESLPFIGLSYIFVLYTREFYFKIEKWHRTRYFGACRMYVNGSFNPKSANHDSSSRQVLRHFPNFRKIRYDISLESSASRRFSWNTMPYLLYLKKSGKIWNFRLLQILDGALRVKLPCWRIHRDHTSKFCSVPSHTSILCVCEKQRLWWDCV